MGILEENIVENKRTFILKDERRITIPQEEVYEIFKGFRPRNMDIEDFKEISKLIKKDMARYLHGTLTHISKVSDEFWSEYTKGKRVKQRGNTYIKKKETDERT
jgi:hypothetical protein